ncbi:hypothetical protein Esti_002161 [Eimeria stiedai]
MTIDVKQEVELLEQGRDWPALLPAFVLHRMNEVTPRLPVRKLFDCSGQLLSGAYAVAAVTLKDSDVDQVLAAQLVLCHSSRLERCSARRCGSKVAKTDVHRIVYNLASPAKADRVDQSACPLSRLVCQASLNSVEKLMDTFDCDRTSPELPTRNPAESARVQSATQLQQSVLHEDFLSPTNPAIYELHELKEIAGKNVKDPTSTEETGTAKLHVLDVR